MTDCKVEAERIIGLYDSDPDTGTHATIGRIVAALEAAEKRGIAKGLREAAHILHMDYQVRRLMTVPEHAARIVRRAEEVERS